MSTVYTVDCILGSFSTMNPKDILLMVACLSIFITQQFFYNTADSKLPLIDQA